MAHPINPADDERARSGETTSRTDPRPLHQMDRVNGAAGIGFGSIPAPGDDRPGGDRPATAAGVEPSSPAPTLVPDRASVVARQRERFGGIKVGSAFFGWLAATGMAVLLIALLAAAGVAFGVATNTEVSVDQAVQESQNGTGTAQTVGLVGAITLLVVLFVAYYCGGYVAGRMARFNGIRQGLAVWLWGVVMALVIAAVAAIAGAQYDVFAQLKLPRLPVNEGQVTATGLIVIGAAILAALIGALVGGLAGMRFHRNVDKAGLEPAVN